MNLNGKGAVKTVLFFAPVNISGVTRIACHPIIGIAMYQVMSSQVCIDGSSYQMFGIPTSTQ